MDPFASALDQAAAIRRREVRPRELVEMYLRRIERYNPQLNHYWEVTADLALKMADQAEAVREGGVLHGVTVSLKAEEPLEGHAATFGAFQLRNLIAPHDSFIAKRLKEEQMPILGITTMSEFGSRPLTEHGLHGTAHNPWNLEHNTGGSSGGAGGALAAGLCAISNSHDGGGSTRIPAACNGLVGLKPSRGLISEAPYHGEMWAGLAMNGIISRTVADCAAGLQTAVGHDPGDPYWTEPAADYLAFAKPGDRRLRIGFTTAGTEVWPEVQRAVEDTAELLSELGHDVDAGGPDLSGFREVMAPLVIGATGLMPVDPNGEIDPFNGFGFQLAPSISAADYVKAEHEMHRLSREAIAWWNDHDVLVTPTIPRTAPRNGELGATVDAAIVDFLEFIAFVQPFNCTGQPALTLPLAVGSDGLPIGVQLVGPPRGEDVVLALGAQLEDARPWRDRRPPGFQD
ncbi:MAG TPA: amidase [Candidatus Dormibacteraeota bacterium]